ncbi:MAG: O-acetyl-ADP-ribose deacetylase [Nanobdellota archaeon]
MEIRLMQGDLTKQECDAIINAANKSLQGGGGIDGKIHRKAGEKLREECTDILQHDFPQGLPTGEAVITQGYNLPAPFIIHTVGPVYDGEDKSHLLASSIRRSLEVAEEHQLQRVAFPAISTGAYGYPMREAAEVFKEVFRQFPAKHLKEVVVCLHKEEDLEVFKEVFSDIGHQEGMTPN